MENKNKNHNNNFVAVNFDVIKNDYEGDITGIYALKVVNGVVVSVFNSSLDTINAEEVLRYFNSFVKGYRIVGNNIVEARLKLIKYVDYVPDFYNNKIIDLGYVTSLLFASYEPLSLDDMCIIYRYDLESGFVGGLEQCLEISECYKKYMQIVDELGQRARIPLKKVNLYALSNRRGGYWSDYIKIGCGTSYSEAVSIMNYLKICGYLSQEDCRSMRLTHGTKGEYEFAV